MKVALTVWDGRISPVFDVCREVLLLEVQGTTERQREQHALPLGDAHTKAERLVQLGVQKLICGAISAPIAAELRARGVEVLGFVAGDVRRVVRALLAGVLPAPAFAMPGCVRKRRDQRRQRSQRRRGRLSGRR